MKICVVGAGYWGNNHIRTLNNLGCLGGVVETNPEFLNSLNQKYINIKTFNNLKDSLKEESFTGFVVATPAETHYSLAKEIILNNKQLEFFKWCGSLVIRVWTVEDYRAVQEKGHCYTQVIPEAGAIALGGLP